MAKFVKGQSGNPKGNPEGRRVSKSFMDFVRGHSVQAINACWDLANDKTVRASDRLTAYKIVIEYAEGKPRQTVDVNGTMTYAEALKRGVQRARSGDDGGSGGTPAS